MRTLALITFVSTIASGAVFFQPLQPFDPFEGAKPLAVLIQSDPWAMVMDADTPRVAVYEDGSVIFVKKTQDGASYQSRMLTETQMSEFKEHLAPVAALKELKSFYNLRPGVHDLPAAKFYLRVGAREIAVRAYGLMTSGTKLPAYTVTPDGRKPDSMPSELLDLHKFLCSVDYSESKEWAPKYVEVMIWPYEYAPDASINWPKDSAGSRLRPDEEARQFLFYFSRRSPSSRGQEFPEHSE